MSIERARKLKEAIEKNFKDRKEIGSQLGALTSKRLRLARENSSILEKGLKQMIEDMEEFDDINNS